MSIFNRDTTLYHPVEGAKLFPQGEQHPGAAWFDTPDCGKVTDKSDKALKRELRTTEEAVQTLQGELDAANSQITGQAAAHVEEIEALNGAHAEAITAKDAQIVGLEADINKLIEQRDAALAGKAPEPEAPPAPDPLDRDGDGKPGGSEPDSEADKAEKASIRAQIKGLGFGTCPGPRGSVEAFRAALEDAQAEAAKAAE